MQLVKLANTFFAWLSGLEAGEEDVKNDQWGDSRSAWRAWLGYLKEHDVYDESLKDSFPEYKRGYEKALVNARGEGMPVAPRNQDLKSHEDFLHPFGENEREIDG